MQPSLQFKNCISCAGESNDGSHCLLTRRVTSGRRASSSPASYPEIVKMWYVRTGAYFLHLIFSIRTCPAVYAQAVNMRRSGRCGLHKPF